MPFDARFGELWLGLRSLAWHTWRATLTSRLYGGSPRSVLLGASFTLSRFTWNWVVFGSFAGTVNGGSGGDRS